MLAAACQVLGVTKLDSKIRKSTSHLAWTRAVLHNNMLTYKQSQLRLLTNALGALTGESAVETKDGVYNYARNLCHFGSLIMEVIM